MWPVALAQRQISFELVIMEGCSSNSKFSQVGGHVFYPGISKLIYWKRSDSKYFWLYGPSSLCPKDLTLCHYSTKAALDNVFCKMDMAVFQ